MIGEITRSSAYSGMSPLGFSSPVKAATTTLVVLAALSNLPQARGSDRFVNCMDSCDKIEADLGKLICQTACLFMDWFKNKK